MSAREIWNGTLSSSSGLEIQVAHGVNSVQPEAWDSLSAGREFASHRWYQYGEAVFPHDQPAHFIVHQRGRPVARAAFWLTRDIPLPSISRPFHLALRAVLARRPVLLCRAPLADLPGLALPAVLDPGLRAAALAQIAQAAHAYAAQHRASFVVYDYLTAGEANPAAGWPPGFAAAEVQEPGTRLRLCQPDFAGYLGQLRASARKTYRWHRNNAARLGIETRRYASVPRLGEALRLIENVAQHFGSPTPWARLALENMHMTEAVWIAAEQAGRAVAACLYLRDGPGAMITLLGRDYAVPYAYFQVAYEGVACAIESGARALRGGSGAYEFKERLGFERTVNHHAAYAAVSPGLRWLARWAAA